MSSALYTATSALQANQLRLNVIANNIANVNTLGFKSSSANFATVFANTMYGGSMPNGTLGGTNPRQVGNGTLVSQIAANFGQGGTQFTGRNTDLYINGNGFFVIERNSTNTGNNATDYSLTRAGNFSLDSSGNLVTASGNRVRGTSQVSGNAVDALGRVQIPKTFLIVKDYDDNDALLGTHLAPSGTDASDISNAITAGTTEQTTTEVTLTNFSISTDGSIAATYSNGDIITLRLNQATVDANPNDPSQWRTEMIHIPYEGGTYASKNITADDKGGMDQIGATPVFDGGIGSDSDTGLEGMQLHVQMASVSNPEGLQYDGNNNFLIGANTGTPEFGSAGAGSRGTLNAGALESSNVDLSGEFTGMVIAQRGLEAASKVIRTQSEVMQTIINML